MGSPHAEASALTTLQQADAPGLRVLHKGVWVPVPPSSDRAFVANVSDVLIQIISNGRFKIVLHRAMVQNTSRISIANFMAPGVDDLMQSAVELCNNMNPLYNGVTFGDLLKFVVAQGYGTESRAVENFRL